jgi:hypothetical protein
LFDGSNYYGAFGWSTCHNAKSFPQQTLHTTHEFRLRGIQYDCVAERKSSCGEYPVAFNGGGLHPGITKPCIIAGFRVSNCGRAQYAYQNKYNVFCYFQSLLCNVF